MPTLAQTLQLAVDRREYPRVPVELTGQIFIAEEAAGRSAQVTNLSVRGAGIKYTGSLPRPGRNGILTADGFGSFEGVMARNRSDTYGFQFLLGEAERNHLQECLAVFVRSGPPMLAVLRKNDLWTENSQLSLTRYDGKQLECEVVEISLHGVALRTSIPIPKGEHVLIGKMFGRVVGGLSGSITVQFLRYVGSRTAATALG